MWLMSQHSCSRLTKHATVLPLTWIREHELSFLIFLGHYTANPSKQDHSEPQILSIKIHNASKYSFQDKQLGKKKTYGKILGSLQGTIILKAQEEKIFLGKIKRYFWERFNIETRKKVKTKN